MNDTVDRNSLPATRPTREVRVVQDDGAQSYLFDTARFEHMQRIAQLMANATLTPKHLKGSTPQESLANCFRVANQAVRWGMDPFAIMDETYVVHGRLGYQGKLVMGVVNARAGLTGRLNFKFSGAGADRTIEVIGHFSNEDEPRTITLSVAQAKTDNEMWKKNPDQKLVYSGSIMWARRHCPEITLGVLTEEDLEAFVNSRPQINTGMRPAPSLPPPVEIVDQTPATAAPENSLLTSSEPVGGGDTNHSLEPESEVNSGSESPEPEPAPPLTSTAGRGQPGKEDPPSHEPSTTATSPVGSLFQQSAQLETARQITQLIEQAKTQRDLQDGPGTLMARYRPQFGGEWEKPLLDLYVRRWKELEPKKKAGGK